MMHFTSAAFYTVFAANLVLNWGLLDGLLPYRPFRWRRLLSLGLFMGMIASLFSLVHYFLLLPNGLISLAPVLFSILLLLSLAAYQLVCQFWLRRPQALRSILTDDVHLSTLLYAALLVAGSQAMSVPQVLGISLFAILGYIGATILVKDIMDRLALSRLPEAFKGLPSLFLTVGLVAMAFSGIHRWFFLNIFQG